MSLTSISIKSIAFMLLLSSTYLTGDSIDATRDMEIHDNANNSDEAITKIAQSLKDYNDCHLNSYYDSGELHQKMYLDNSNNCIEVTYDKTGIKRSIVTLEFSDRNGASTYFSSTGKLIKKIYWDQDVATYGVLYDNGKKRRNLSAKEINAINSEYRQTRPSFSAEPSPKFEHKK